jgi:hypothetical protein
MSLKFSLVMIGWLFFSVIDYGMNKTREGHFGAWSQTDRAGALIVAAEGPASFVVLSFWLIVTADPKKQASW